jgi:replicative DNA helicase
MMELALIRTMMDKDFYDDHKGIRCPDKIFTKDVRKIKQTLDYAMETYDKSLTPSELEALFLANNSSMTTANKQVFNDLFHKVGREKPLSKDIATDVLSKLFQQVVGEEIANIGFDYVNGSRSGLEPLRSILSDYEDNFLPKLNIDWDDTSIETLLKLNDQQSKWKWNIPSLGRYVEGISPGHFVVVAARPNTGKTSFHASTIAAPNGFAHQGAKCVILCNEEASHRVGARYLNAATSMSVSEVQTNMVLAATRYDLVDKNIFIKDSSGKDMEWAEAVIRAYEPDIVVLDMGSKFATGKGDRTDLYLKDAAIHARNIAKQYNCVIMWMSQLSAAAEGLTSPDKSMIEGSKTGLAAEADLMLLIARNKINKGDFAGEEQEDLESNERHINVDKNKLKGGWHGRITCQLDGDRSQYLP